MTADQHVDRVLPTWEEATDLLRSTFLHRAVREGGGYAFTLNLAPDVIEAALKDERGFTAHIRRKLDRHLKRRGGTASFWFAVEATDNGRPHLHGGILPGQHSLAELKAILKAVGGSWAGETGRQYQVNLKHRDDDAWASYAVKGTSRTSNLIPGSLFTATNDIRRRAKQIYAEKRKAASAIKLPRTKKESKSLMTYMR